MKRITLTAFCVCAMALSLHAQIKDDVEQTQSDVSWMEKHYFHTIGGMLLFDYFIPPAFEKEYIYETSQGFDTNTYYLRSWGFNLASVTYEGRINLYDFNEKMSVSANVPVGFGFGVVEPGGACSFVMPVIFDFNYGLHSTYNNIDRIGFHAGIGMDFLMTPLFKFDSDRDVTQFWAAPMARIGVKGPYKRRNAFLTVQMTLPQKYFDDDENQTFRQRVHFKAVFGILLNYD